MSYKQPQLNPAKDLWSYQITSRTLLYCMDAIPIYFREKMGLYLVIFNVYSDLVCI